MKQINFVSKWKQHICKVYRNVVSYYYHHQGKKPEQQMNKTTKQKNLRF